MQLSSGRRMGLDSAAGRWGTGLSLACAVHCAALPLLAGWSGLGHGHLPGGFWLEATLIGTAAVIGMVTLSSGYRRHGRPIPLILLATGLLMLALAHQEAFHQLEMLGGILGAVLLLSAQWTNGRCSSACCSGSAVTHSGHDYR